MLVFFFVIKKEAKGTMQAARYTKKKEDFKEERKRKTRKGAKVNNSHRDERREDKRERGKDERRRAERGREERGSELGGLLIAAELEGFTPASISILEVYHPLLTKEFITHFELGFITRHKLGFNIHFELGFATQSKIPHQPTRTHMHTPHARTTCCMLLSH